MKAIKRGRGVVLKNGGKEKEQSRTRGEVRGRKRDKWTKEELGNGSFSGWLREGL